MNYSYFLSDGIISREEEFRNWANKIVKHFKGDFYLLLDVGQSTEDSGGQMVVYRALYGECDLYIRPLSVFVEEVPEGKDNPTGQKYRFERVELGSNKEDYDINLKNSHSNQSDPIRVASQSNFSIPLSELLHYYSRRNTVVNFYKVCKPKNTDSSVFLKISRSYSLDAKLRFSLIDESLSKRIDMDHYEFGRYITKHLQTLNPTVFGGFAAEKEVIISGILEGNYRTMMREIDELFQKVI
ncbi:hypothetical protein D3C71_1134030 [compost metagenome]